MNECAFPFLELMHPEKGLIKIPYRQFWLNKTQQYAVIAIDFSEGVELGDHDGIEYVSLGKLQDQNVIFEAQINNSLRIQEWDFEKYPNPEVVLIARL